MPFRSNIPVNAADIIAVLIGADIVKFESGALENRVKITLHLAVDCLPDLDLVLTEFFEQFFQPGLILEGQK
jgi:hypothetical protein